MTLGILYLRTGKLEMNNAAERFNIRPSTVAWFVGAVLVGAYDLNAPEHETMSDRFWDSLEHPVEKYLSVAALAITAGHLLNVLPEQIDPFKQFFRHVKGH